VARRTSASTPKPKRGSATGEIDVEKVSKLYESRLRTYRALLDEASFILGQSISVANIKIHAVEGRIKEKTSIIKKASIKSIMNPLSDLNDIVGCRVICLLRSDISKLGTIISDNFVVLETDDKINTSTDSFGYMSIHYICTMRNEFSGPRYDTIKNIKFEIQVRTLSMHAWAVISAMIYFTIESGPCAPHLQKDRPALR